MGQANGSAAGPACTPRLWRASDATEVGRLAFAVVADLLRARPTAVISLTTGTTTRGLYQALSAACRSGSIALSAARLVSSEEYLGVSDDDPISLFGWLRRDLLDPCGVAPAAVLRLAGDSADPLEECARFDAALQRLGGLDLVVQSVGVNGHFGFNEPGCSRDAATRVVTLTPITRESNATYWPPGTRRTSPGPGHGRAADPTGRACLCCWRRGRARPPRWPAGCVAPLTRSRRVRCYVWPLA